MQNFSFLSNLCKASQSKLLENTKYVTTPSGITLFYQGDTCTDIENLLKTTHEQITSHLGSLPQVISRLLKKFEHKNLLELSFSSIKIL